MSSKVLPVLADDAVVILKEYLKAPRTRFLRELAPLIVEMRSNFRLGDGRTDWSGRSTDYRQLIADVYRRAQVPTEALDRLQSALRYHVGNLIRDRASNDELVSVGLTTVAPKERIRNTRDALYAMQEVSAPRQDIPRLAAYAQALLEYADDAVVPEMTPDHQEAACLALEAAQERADELLTRLRTAQVPPSKTPQGGPRKDRTRLQGV